MYNLSNAPTAQSPSTRLKSNAIHDVKFDGIFSETVSGKETGQEYNVLKLKFSSEDGKTFEDMIFEPKAGDEVRQDNNFGYQNPSNVEEMMFKLRHLITAVHPKLNEQLAKKEIAVNSWAELVKFMVTNLEKAKGAKTQIKLLANKDGYAIFPRYTLGINKEGHSYPRTNYIGAALTFTASELKKINESATARPSSMPETELLTNDEGDGEGNGMVDLDLEIDIDVNDI